MEVAIPSLEVVIPALLALLLALGSVIYSITIGDLLTSIPLVGGAISRFTGWAIGRLSWLWNQTSGFVETLTTIVINHSTEQGLNVQTHVSGHAAIQRVATVTVPQVVEQHVAPVAAALAELNGGTTSFIGQQVAWDGHTTAQLDQVGNQANTLLPAQIQNVRDELSTDFTTITAARVADQAQTARDIAAAQGVATAAGAATAVKTLTPQIAAIGSEVGNLAGQITGVVTGPVATVIAGVTALTGRLTKVEECTADICAAGAGPNLAGLSNLLNELTPLLEAGVLFAFVAAAAKDPAGVATDVQNVLSPIASTAESVFSTLTGISV